MLYGSPGFVQDAALVALTARIDEVPALHALYRERSAAIADELAGTPLAPRMPEGGMFLLIDVRSTGLSGDAFARRLLDEEDVSVLPGEGFGPSSAGHVRICVTTDESRLREACRRIAAASSGSCARRASSVRAPHAIQGVPGPSPRTARARSTSSRRARGPRLSGRPRARDRAHVALALEKPLLLEGEAGVGKTEVAKTLADVHGGRLIRLQCYEGIDVAHALYEWNYARQLLASG